MFGPFGSHSSNNTGARRSIGEGVEAIGAGSRYVGGADAVKAR
jgi:hypothetical protein